MKDQIVTHEIAKALKELEFNEPCTAFYNPAPDWMTNKEPRIKGHFTNSFKEYFNDKLKIENTAAPLWQQAIEWLITKNIWLEFWINPATKNFECTPLYLDTQKRIYEGIICAETFKEVREQAILKAIETLKK